ncbi:hypothetical protein ARALYDRAFT_914972 [Arabidopsis lyrata subsp. lyrata]|uniref:Uncharacterized protein n=1 Tax=Arabidopsis lyrata subsp. lyrata TaxID=81972 RepID=D7MBY7_ARALL|nr:hypothetical protein ARALYDRAFT_914972 [Arabidopsis lyrata subsp. lyrata]
MHARVGGHEHTCALLSWVVWSLRNVCATSVPHGRIYRTSQFDLWTDRDGPQLFESVDDLPSARFFPKGVVHSVKPYGRLSSTSVVDGDSDGEVSEVKDEEIGKKLRGRRVRNRFGVMGIERGEEGGKRRIENRVNGGRLRNGKSSQVYEMTLQNGGRYEIGS